jgi:hypothetical protein
MTPPDILAIIGHSDRDDSELAMALTVPSRLVVISFPPKLDRPIFTAEEE